MKGGRIFHKPWNEKNSLSWTTHPHEKLTAGFPQKLGGVKDVPFGGIFRWTFRRSWTSFLEAGVG